MAKWNGKITVRVDTGEAVRHFFSEDMYRTYENQGYVEIPVVEVENDVFKDRLMKLKICNGSTRVFVTAESVMFPRRRYTMFISDFNDMIPLIRD